MSLPRFFVEYGDQPVLGEVVSLSSDDSHHAVRVLRLNEGDEIIASLSPSNRQFRATISTISSTVTVKFVEELPRKAARVAVTTLLLPILKGDRNEDVADWATELGIERIVFWHAHRSIARIKESEREKKTSRWQKIVEQAAKQSQASKVPLVSIVGDLSEALDLVMKDENVISLSLTPGTPELASVAHEIVAKTGNLALLLGPEGDLTTDEECLARDRGALFMNLGPQILRAELAAVTGIILLNGLSQIAPNKGR